MGSDPCVSLDMINSICRTLLGLWFWESFTGVWHSQFMDCGGKAKLAGSVYEANSWA
jgi:hypothetical protein